MSGPKVVLHISLSVDAYNRLLDYSDTLGLSRSKIVDLLLRDPSSALALHLATELIKNLKRG